MDIMPEEKRNEEVVYNIHDNIERWHKRFGHQHIQTLIKMKNDSAVDGLNFNNQYKNEEFNCLPCITAKTARKTFTKHCEVKTNRPLELIHMDLCGPLPSPSIAGSKYINLLIDDYSRKHFIYFLKRKNEALDFF